MTYIPSDETIAELYDIRNDDKFVLEVLNSIRLIEQLEGIDYFNELFMSEKEIREKLDSLKFAIDEIPLHIRMKIPPALDEVYEHIQEPLEAGAPDRRFPKPLRRAILMFIENVFDELGLPINTYDQGEFARTVSVVCRALDIEGIDSHNVARDAVKLKSRRSA